MKRIIIYLIFLFVPLLAFPADNRKLTWDPVPGAWGYFIEIKDSAGESVATASVTDNFFGISKLEPGSYTFRIATLNIMKQKGESSKWISFTVEKLILPGLNSVSKKLLVSTEKNKNIIVTGKNFSSETKFILRKNGGTTIADNVSIHSDSEAELSFKPESSMKGICDLVALNKGDAEAVLAGAIEVIEPADVKTDFYIGAEYSANYPMGTWSRFLSPSYKCGSLYFQFSGRKIGLENLVFEAAAGGSIFAKNPSQKKNSSLTAADFGLGSGYYYPVEIIPVDLFFKLRGGLFYNQFKLDESLTGTTSSSLDIFCLASAGIRVHASDSFFIDTAGSWKTVFFKRAYLNTAGFSIGMGVQF